MAFFMKLVHHAIFFYVLFLGLITPYSIFYKSSFTLKLNFEKIKLQKRNISLISLRNWAKHWTFCAKKAFAHFGTNKSKEITRTKMNQKDKDKLTEDYESGWKTMVRIKDFDIPTPAKILYFSFGNQYMTTLLLSVWRLFLSSSFCSACPSSFLYSYLVWLVYVFFYCTRKHLM